MSGPFDPNYKPQLKPEPKHRRENARRASKARADGRGTGFDRMPIGIGVEYEHNRLRILPGPDKQSPTKEQPNDT